MDKTTDGSSRNLQKYGAPQNTRYSVRKQFMELLLAYPNNIFPTEFAIERKCIRNISS
jgi:hypothetical protein